MEITEEQLNKILDDLGMTLEQLIAYNSNMTGYIMLEKHRLEKS